MARDLAAQRMGACDGDDCRVFVCAPGFSMTCTSTTDQHTSNDSCADEPPVIAHRHLAIVV